MPWNAVEIAKLAIGDTYISCIDITVDLPGNFSVRHLFFTAFIGHVHELRQPGLFKKEHTFFNSEEFEIEGFLEEVV